jgi:hypothetical protein
MYKEMKSTLRGRRMIKDDEINWNHTLRGRDLTKERDQNFLKAHK